MKLTLANVKELKRNSSSPLFKRVCNYIIDTWGDYNDKKYIFTDVLHHGCQSGVVTELIYYSDTVRFYVDIEKAAHFVRLFLVGVARFELAALRSRTVRATKLRYTPIMVFNRIVLFL